MGVIKQLSQSLKSRGTYGTLRWVYYGYLTVNKFIVFYKDLQNSFSWPRYDSSIKLLRISLEDLESLRHEHKILPIEFYCDITHRFNTPYIALVNGKVAAIYWLVYPGEASRFLELGDGDVELNYSTILPEYRGRGLAQLLMAYIIESCKEQNLKRMFGVVNVSNIPQYKPMLRLGFEPVEVLTHFGFNRPKATLRYIK